MFKSIDGHALVLQNNLHWQFLLQNPCYNIPELKLASVSPIYANIQQSIICQTI